MHSSKAGQLNTGRTRTSSGKIVDEWVFSLPVSGSKSPDLRVDIVIDKPSDKGIQFIARGPCLPEPIMETDIEVLRRKVEAALRFQHEKLTGLVWEDWLEVIVSGKRGHSAENEKYPTSGSTISVKVNPFKRAVDPASGTVLYINFNGIALPLQPSKRAGEYDGKPPVPGHVETLKTMRFDRRETDDEYSYIPATAENLRGLNDLLDRMQELRGKLSEFLRQDNIAPGLADLTSRTPALPAPL